MRPSRDTSRPLIFPYGIADFRGIRRQGMYYADRTAYVREIERLGRTLVFLRPRRFGKSLWLHTLAEYYDLRSADDFAALFGDLDVGREPTQDRSNFFVLQWNFSAVSAAGDVADVAESLRRHIGSQARTFAARYREHLSLPIAAEASSALVLEGILRSIERTPHRLCLLIDEYDNFVNEIMARDPGTYRALFDNDGPFKELFKSVKWGTEGQGIEKVFVTGVSPVALNDLTSGFNIAKDVSHRPELAGLCGFREEEILAVLDDIATRRGVPSRTQEHFETLRTWYNGYRFAEDAEDLVYNPANVLYFLEHLENYGKPPRELHDPNLRTDRGKLAFLSAAAAGTGVIERLTAGDGTVEVYQLRESFSLADLLRLGEDPDAIASFLYYMGLLTRTRDVPPKLCIPNLVVRKLFLDRLLEIYLSEPRESTEVRHLAMHFARDGSLRPLLDFFEEKIFPVLSNRDLGAAPRGPGMSGAGVNEMAIKALFLSILFDDQRYAAFSELEIEQRYADLCLIVRPEMRVHGYFDVLFEFKMVRLRELGIKGKELQALNEGELRELHPVASALRAARSQVLHYREVLRRRFPETAPRCYVVVAVGLARILGEEVSRRTRP